MCLIPRSMGASTANRDLLQRSLLHQRRGACVASTVGTPRTSGRGDIRPRRQRLRGVEYGPPQQAHAAPVIRLRRTTTDVDTLPARSPDGVRTLDPLMGITQGLFHVKRCVGDERRSPEGTLPCSR